MKKKISIILAAIFLTVMGLTTITEAKQMSNNALSPQQKGIVPIAAFTATGDLDKLKIALNEGLDAGLTVNEVKEILVQLYAYCGFPRSINAIHTFMEVMDERKAQGIRDEMGPEASAIPANIDKNEYGMLVRQKLFGNTTEPAPSGYQLATPVLDDFLKEHLFADIFYRDNLNYLNREITTISALANMPGTNYQLQGHIKAAVIVGLTEAQARDLIEAIGAKVGKSQGDNVADLLRKVLN